PKLGIPEKVPTMRRMLTAVALGHQHLNLLPDHLCPMISEESLRLRIDQADAPVLFNDHHRVGSRLEQAAKLRLGPTPLRHIADGRHGNAPLPRLDGTQADLRWKLRPVLAHAPQLDTRAHRTRSGRLEVSGPIRRVPVSVGPG